MTRNISVFTFAILAAATFANADTPAEKLLRKPDRWFQSTDAKRAMECILSWQSEFGGWPKNKDTTRENFSGDRSKLKARLTMGQPSASSELLPVPFGLQAKSNTRGRF